MTSLSVAAASRGHGDDPILERPPHHSDPTLPPRPAFPPPPDAAPAAVDASDKPTVRAGGDDPGPPSAPASGVSSETANQEAPPGHTLREHSPKNADTETSATASRNHPTASPSPHPPAAVASSTDPIPHQQSHPDDPTDADNPSSGGKAGAVTDKVDQPLESVPATTGATVANPSTPPPATAPAQSATMNRLGEQRDDMISAPNHHGASMLGVHTASGMLSGALFDPFDAYTGDQEWLPRGGFPSTLQPLSTPQTHNRQPATVTPSQVHIRNHMSEREDGVQLEPSEFQEPARRHLDVFARLEFADSEFQVTTYKVVIGRDRAALRQALMDEVRQERYQAKVEENRLQGLPPPEPPQRDRNKFSKSYISEEGGILGPESSADDSDGLHLPKRRKLDFPGSSTQDRDQAKDRRAYDRQYVSHTPGAAAVDVDALRPSPDYTAFLGIHSPGPDTAKKSKAISRQHVMIQYKKDTRQWEAVGLHNNGFFHQEIHQGSGNPVVLRCGDRLQIKDVAFNFYISGVREGCTGAESDARQRRIGGGKDMSFDFDDSRNGQTQDTSDDELSDYPENDEDIEMMSPSRRPTPARPAGTTTATATAAATATAIATANTSANTNANDTGTANTNAGAAAVSQEPEDQPMEDAPKPATAQAAARVPVPTGQLDIDPSLMEQIIPKKRGPGRPPKNGIMSKRQQRELKKLQQERERQEAAQAPAATTEEAPPKRKVGRPRKHPLPEGDAEAERRKYKARKIKAEDGAEGSDAERRAKEKKSRTARPKSPPLQLNREDYTEEQLQKPPKNYCTLIDETLSAAPEGLTLKQIYKRISMNYPWFYFHTETKGWESSVRHNLIGHDAFKKDELGNVWKRVPGVDLDMRRSKNKSPDRTLHAQASNLANSYYRPAQQQHAAHPPPGYHPGHQTPQGYQQQMAAFNGQHQQQQPPHAHGSVPRQLGPAGAIPHAPSTNPPAQQPAYGQQHMASYAGSPPSYSSPYSHPPQSRANPHPGAPGAASANPTGANGSMPMPAHPSVTTTPGAAIYPSQGPPQSRQQSQQPGPTASATPAAARPSHPPIEPSIVERLNQLRMSLVNSLRNANTPHAENIVWSALDRLIGLKTDESGMNSKLEETCYNGMNNMAERCIAQLRRTPTPDGNNASPAGLLHPDVRRHIQGLRNRFVEAIKARIPENDAIALVHSAIVRSLGLATESRLANPSANLDSLEKAIMRNVDGVINQISSAAGRASSERASSAGPRPSPAAAQGVSSSTPRQPTPAGAQASAASASVRQASAASPPMPTTTAPLATARPPTATQPTAPQATVPQAAAPQTAASQAPQVPQTTAQPAPASQPTAPPTAAPQAPAPQTSGPQATGTQPAVPQTAAPQGAVSQGAASQAPQVPRATSQQAAPATPAPQGAASQVPAAQATVSQPAAPQAPAPQASATQTPAPQGLTTQARATQAPAPQASTPQASPPQGAAQATSTQGAGPQVSLPQPLVPEASAPQPPAPHAAAPQAPPPQASPPQASPP